MERVTQGHRDTIRSGDVARVGGYTASTEEQLEAIEAKLDRSGDETEKPSRRKPKPAKPADDGLDKLEESALRDLAKSEDVEIAGDAPVADVAAAIRKKRQEKAT